MIDQVARGQHKCDLAVCKYDYVIVQRWLARLYLSNVCLFVCEFHCTLCDNICTSLLCYYCLCFLMFLPVSSDRRRSVIRLSVRPWLYKCNKSFSTRYHTNSQREFHYIYIVGVVARMTWLDFEVKSSKVKVTTISNLSKRTLGILMWCVQTWRSQATFTAKADGVPSTITSCCIGQQITFRCFAWYFVYTRRIR